MQQGEIGLGDVGSGLLKQVLLHSYTKNLKSLQDCIGALLPIFFHEGTLGGLVVRRVLCAASEALEHP